MADYGFNRSSHAQTHGDIEDGGAALSRSNDATHQLNSAQTQTRWPSEPGTQDFRQKTVAFFDSVNDTLAEEKEIFETFRTNLSIAEKEAENTEEGNAAVLEAINHALQSDPATLAPSAPAAPSASGTSASGVVASAPSTSGTGLPPPPRLPRARSPRTRPPRPARCPSSER